MHNSEKWYVSLKERNRKGIPITTKEFREFSEFKMKRRNKELTKVRSAIWIVIDYFMLMTPANGIPTNNRFTTGPFLQKDIESVDLHHSIKCSYTIRVEDRKTSEVDKEGFHLWINKDWDISGHIFDQGFDTFWKKAVNLMCQIFGTEIIFPETPILNNKRDWLEIALDK